MTAAAIGYTLSSEEHAPTDLVRNAGSADTTNVVATLLATGGVTNPDGPYAYGALYAGGAPVTNCQVAARR